MIVDKPQDNSVEDSLFNWQILKDNLIDSTVIKSIIRDFVADCAEKIATIESAYQGQDWPEVRKLSHTLKGACATMAATGMLAKAQQMDQAAHDREPLSFRAQLEELRGLHQEAQSLVENNQWPEILND